MAIAAQNGTTGADFVFERGRGISIRTKLVVQKASNLQNLAAGG
jgi:hypothetical protein